MTRPTRLSAAEAARRLGVRRETLYAYVSRGLIRSERQRGTRARLYDAEDVAQLVRRRRARRDPGRAASEVLHHFGAPVLESGLTLIRDGELYYRGVAVRGLLGQASFEQVAGLLWGGGLATGIPDVVPALPPALRRLRPALADLPAIERFQVVLAAVAADDAAAYDTRADGVRRVGAKVLRLLAAAAVGEVPSARGIAEVLQRGWLPRQRAARELLEAALVLWADHELNVSTFTVRCVASAAATPYAAVIAGLSALSGSLHGGGTARVEALLDEVERPERAREVLEAKLRRGEHIAGLGHWLYREGDPRARALLERLRDAGDPVRPGALAVAEAVERESERLIGRAPNVDFATVVLRRTLGMPPGSALALVAVARSAGWIAHAIEQYADGHLIRPRAHYVGEPPPA